jgi:hypothetical protein
LHDFDQFDLFMGAPQLGEVEAGTPAALVSAPFSVVTGGAACLIAAVIAPGGGEESAQI